MTTHIEHESGRRIVPAFDLTDRLRKAREIAGYDQSEFAEVLGITRQSIGNYESGRRTPARPYLIAWADRCGVDLTWLETGHEPEDMKDDRSHLSDLNRRPVLYEGTALPLS